jgi:TldD protein
MIKIARNLITTMLFLIFIPVFSQNDELLEILEQELNYQFNALQKEKNPPYYMSFRVSDKSFVRISSTNGSITDFSEDKMKLFSPVIRVGDYNFDNTHTGENSMPLMDGDAFGCRLPEENDPNLVKYKIWETNNEYYRNVVDEYLDKREKNDTVKDKKSKDFSAQIPEKYFEPKPTKDEYFYDEDLWKTKLNRYTSVFQNIPEIFIARSEFNMRIDRQYFLSTNGTSIVENKFLCSLGIFIMGRSSTGEFIPYSNVYYAFTSDGLPNDSIIIKNLVGVRDKLINLSYAPKAEPYTGPAILSPEATGVFFHEILGHRIEGHRMGLPYNSKTFKDKINKLVLNKDISVYSDPTLNNYNGQDLIGYYKYDDQGVRSQRVENISNGVLKEFLMSRKPVLSFNLSNGHGRGDIYSSPVARQSNLFVTTSNPKSFSYLKKKLIKECKKQGVEYGYYFKTVSGGYTNTMNFRPDFFNIIPLEVYRIYVDGRPNELVRGVNLIGTPLTIFSEIIAAGDQTGIFSGICGAESGQIPVTAIAPATLIRKIETQNQFVFKPEWPILPDPESITNH